jgi:hypothetical protein
MAEKILDLRLSHFEGMALFMKKNISFDPGNIGLFSSDGIVLPPNKFANLIQELLGRFFHFYS